MYLEKLFFIKPKITIVPPQKRTLFFYTGDHIYTGEKVNKINLVNFPKLVFMQKRRRKLYVFYEYQNRWWSFSDVLPDFLCDSSICLGNEKICIDNFWKTSFHDRRLCKFYSPDYSLSNWWENIEYSDEHWQYIIQRNIIHERFSMIEFVLDLKIHMPTDKFNLIFYTIKQFVENVNVSNRIFYYFCKKYWNKTISYKNSIKLRFIALREKNFYDLFSNIFKISSVEQLGGIVYRSLCENELSGRL